jgi:hypothetical protein
LDTFWVTGDQVGLTFTVFNGPEADEANAVVTTFVYGYDELVAEYTTLTNNLPLSVDVNAYASSFFSSGGPYDPGGITMAYFRLEINNMDRDGSSNSLRLGCHMGLEFRDTR